MQTHLLGICFDALARAYYVEVHLQVSIGDFDVAWPHSTHGILVRIWHVHSISHVLSSDVCLCVLSAWCMLRWSCSCFKIRLDVGV